MFPESLESLLSIDLESLPLNDGDVRIGACVGCIPKIVGVGLNYTDQLVEHCCDLSFKRGVEVHT